MAKNKETMSTNITGIVDAEELTVTEIDTNGGETVYSIMDRIKRYNGLETSITFKVDTDIEPLNQD